MNHVYEHEARLIFVACKGARLPRRRTYLKTMIRILEKLYEMMHIHN